MGKVMQWYLFWASISAALVTSNANETSRLKRANAENFDILLNIYKMNPLKESNVFKTFSNTILLPRPAGRIPDLNFDSNESTKEKRIRMRAKFNQIEDAIHVTRLSKTIVKRPSLNIQERIASFKARHRRLTTNAFTNNQNNLEIPNIINLEGKGEKTVKHASEYNRKIWSNLNLTHGKTAHKSITDTTRIRFAPKLKTNEISFDSNGIAVL